MDPKIKLKTIEEENEEEITLEKDDNNVVLPVPSSEQKEKNVTLVNEIENKGIEENVRIEEDVEVNIIGNYGFKGLEEDVDMTDVDKTESDSSFGGHTDSDADEDQYRVSEKLLRNKKVTGEWRRISEPIRRRCKWIELQLVKLKYLEEKYERELAALDQQKQCNLSNYAVDDVGVKSVPRFEGIQRNKIMMRRKRKKAEECSSSSYMSNHPLFSYFEKKNQSNDDVEDLDDDVERNADDFGEDLKFRDMWPKNPHEDKDKALLEIIKKIDELESYVAQTKTRLNVVINENHLGKIGSSDEDTEDDVLMEKSKEPVEEQKPNSSVEDKNCNKCDN